MTEISPTTMVRFRVFLGAPVAADVGTDPDGYVWQTIQESPYPPATLDAASRRVSLLYQNVIFDDVSEPDPDHDDDCPGMSLSPGIRGSADRTVLPKMAARPLSLGPPHPL